MFNFLTRLFRKETPEPPTTGALLNRIPFHLVEDWKPGDRVSFAGSPGKILDIVPHEIPSGEKIASIGVMYDDEPGVIRLVESDFHLLKFEEG